MNWRALWRDLDFGGDVDAGACCGRGVLRRPCHVGPGPVLLGAAGVRRAGGVSKQVSASTAASLLGDQGGRRWSKAVRRVHRAAGGTGTIWATRTAAGGGPAVFTARSLSPAKGDPSPGGPTPPPGHGAADILSMTAVGPRRPREGRGGLEKAYLVNRGRTMGSTRPPPSPARVPWPRPGAGLTPRTVPGRII